VDHFDHMQGKTRSRVGRVVPAAALFTQRRSDRRKHQEPSYPPSPTSHRSVARIRSLSISWRDGMARSV